MDFEANLKSESVSDHAAAAIFLRSEGTAGEKHLPALFERCQAVDLNAEHDQFEEALLGFGAMSMGSILNSAGFDAANTLHSAIESWIVSATQSSNTKVAGYAIYGLGNLGPTSQSIEQLTRIVLSDLRQDEDEHVTIRAVALRNLRKLAPDSALKFADTPAFTEYSQAIKHWIETDASKNPETNLAQEQEWISSAEQG